MLDDAAYTWSWLVILEEIRELGSPPSQIAWTSILFCLQQLLICPAGSGVDLLVRLFGLCPVALSPSPMVL